MVSTSNDSDQSRFTDGCSFERRGATFITSDYGSLGIVAVSKQMLQGTIQGSGDKLSKKTEKYFLHWFQQRQPFSGGSQ
jgi:hypothetical protein